MRNKRNITTIQIDKSTQKRLLAYKQVYKTYNNALLFLMDQFENPK